MATPEWLRSQLADRESGAEALAAAADQMNVCRDIADSLNGNHHTDPKWQDAAVRSHRLADRAEAYGHDEYAVAAEANRRRGAAS